MKNFKDLIIPCNHNILVYNPRYLVDKEVQDQANRFQYKIVSQDDWNKFLKSFLIQDV